MTMAERWVYAPDTFIFIIGYAANTEYTVHRVCSKYFSQILLIAQSAIKDKTLPGKPFLVSVYRVNDEGDAENLIQVRHKGELWPVPCRVFICKEDLETLKEGKEF